MINKKNILIGFVVMWIVAIGSFVIVSNFVKPSSNIQKQKTTTQIKEEALNLEKEGDNAIKNNDSESAEAKYKAARQLYSGIADDSGVSRMDAQIYFITHLDAPKQEIPPSPSAGVDK